MTTDRYTNLTNNARSTVSQFRMPQHPVAKVAVVALAVIVGLTLGKFVVGVFIGLGGLLFGLLKFGLGIAVPVLIIVGLVVLVKAILK